MANFKLNQTGEQIQADLNLIDSNTATQGQVLTANGTGGASWQNASGGGTEVVANPVLSGSETALTGLEVAGTKYKVPSGGSGGGTQLYKHELETDNQYYNLITCISNRQEKYNNIQDIFDDFGNIICFYIPLYGTVLTALNLDSTTHLYTNINVLIVNRSSETSGTTVFTINSISNDYVSSF